MPSPGTPSLGTPSLGTPRQVAFAALRRAAGVPAMVLGATYVGFGSLVHASGMTLPQGLVSTLTGWALPGQIALVELYAAGSSLMAIALAVALTNARLLPMTVALMPMLRQPGTPAWRYFAAAHLVAVTGWAEAMRRGPALRAEERLTYFVAYAMTLWIMTLACTAVGYLASGGIPAVLTLGLVFLNPIYFMLIFAADWKHRTRALALTFGAVLGPALHVATPSYGLLLTGLIAGTAAFAIDRAWRHRRG